MAALGVPSLAGIEDRECLWKPREKGLHIYDEAGVLRADWPESESYDIGPASIAWLNLELIKNASEIGYCRFLYASQKYS
jgi:hypothetical protein